ncbi:MAG: hypothetical protein WCF38_24935, partial [Pseudolabrys sp.]
MRTVNQKIRNAIENELRVTRIDGSWWQFSLTEPSALSLLKISRDRNGALEVRGRSWREDGTRQFFAIPDLLTGSASS